MHYHMDTREDRIADARCGSHNERRARAAIRFAVRNSQGLSLRYRVDSLIGFGSNGVVLVVTALRGKAGDEPLALKIIYKKATAANGEVELLANLTANPHPNLLHLVDAWEDSANHYVVTDLHLNMDCSARNNASAGSLIPLSFFNPRTASAEHIPCANLPSDLWTWSLIRSKQPPARGTRPFTLDHILYPLNPPPMHQVRAVFTQLAAAVRHLHRAGVAHMDIKEENVLVRSSVDGDEDALDVKLADLGHAVQCHGPAAKTATGYGTRDMTAPELLANLRDGFSAKRFRGDPLASDVFALGLLLYSLMHGPSVQPVAVRDTVELGWDLADLVVVGGEYPLGQMRRDMDAGAREVLTGMTMLDPKKRWTMEDVMGHPWCSC
ncbi:hypothetical protein HK101_002934 [Irineochytrium annulatum]|nr:hypothetical protein HK101_002934 [Irineochytrium annulatum]